MEVIAKSTGLFVVIAAMGSIFLWAQDVIKVGAIYSFSGPNAELAELQKCAVEMAVKEVNDAGGVEIGAKKVGIKAIFRDDQGSPGIAAQLIEDMTRNKRITAIIGGTAAQIPLALNEAAKKYKCFLISACATPDAFHDKKLKAPTALGIVPGASDIGRAGASYIADKIKPKKIACFIPSYPFGTALAAGFEAVMKTHPEITYRIFWHPLASPNIGDDLKAVRDFRPDVILIGSWGQDAANVFNEACQEGLGKASKTFHLWTLNPVATGIRPEPMKAVRAQMFSFFDMSGSQDDSVFKTPNDFRAKNPYLCNEPPDAYALASYDAVKEIVRAIKLSQSTDPTKMYQALMANPVWNGAEGEATWLNDGRCMYKRFGWFIPGKRAGEHKEGASGRKLIIPN